MTTITLVIREDSDEEEPEKEKEKEEKEKEKDDKVEDFSDLETKEKESEKEKVTLEEMKVIGLKMNGKRMRPRIGMKAIGPMKMKQRGNQKGKGKGKKGHGPQDQGKGQGDGKGEENYVSPSHSSQSSSQQAALPSSSNASGFFVTHSSMYLTSVKMMEGEDQQKEPDSSGCAFLGQEPDSAMKVEEEGIAFHTKNQTLPTMAILDLGCTRAMSSRDAIDAFCEYVDKHDCGLWYKIEPTSSRFFFANSQQTKCAEKLVIHMYDKAWRVHTTEFDEGNVPLLMSLPQMRNIMLRRPSDFVHLIREGSQAESYQRCRLMCALVCMSEGESAGKFDHEWWPLRVSLVVFHGVSGCGVLRFRMRAKWCPTNPSVQSNQGQSFLSILPDSCFCFAFSGFEGAVWAACLQTNWHPLGLESCLGFCCFGCVPNGAPQTVSATLRGGGSGFGGDELSIPDENFRSFLCFFESSPHDVSCNCDCEVSRALHAIC